MRGLVGLDEIQLRRIDDAIAAFTSKPAAERWSKMHLLLALENEKRELMRANPAIRNQRVRDAA